jgi:hypothetical protein
MQRHIINYKLQVILLSLRNPEENSDSLRNGNEAASGNIPSRKSHN